MSKFNSNDTNVKTERDGVNKYTEEIENGYDPKREEYDENDEFRFVESRLDSFNRHNENVMKSNSNVDNEDDKPDNAKPFTVSVKSKTDKVKNSQRVVSPLLRPPQISMRDLKRDSIDDSMLDQEKRYQRELKERLSQRQMHDSETIKIPKLNIPKDSIEDFSRDSLDDVILDESGRLEYINIEDKSHYVAKPNAVDPDRYQDFNRYEDVELEQTSSTNFMQSDKFDAKRLHEENLKLTQQTEKKTPYKVLGGVPVRQALPTVDSNRFEDVKALYESQFNSTYRGEQSKYTTNNSVHSLNENFTDYRHSDGDNISMKPKRGNLNGTVDVLMEYDRAQRLYGNQNNYNNGDYVGDEAVDAAEDYDDKPSSSRVEYISEPVIDARAYAAKSNKISHVRPIVQHSSYSDTSHYIPSNETELQVTAHPFQSGVHTVGNYNRNSNAEYRIHSNSERNIENVFNRSPQLIRKDPLDVNELNNQNLYQPNPIYAIPNALPAHVQLMQGNYVYNYPIGILPRYESYETNSIASRGKENSVQIPPSEEIDIEKNFVEINKLSTKKQKNHSYQKAMEDRKKKIFEIENQRAKDAALREAKKSNSKRSNTQSQSTNTTSGLSPKHSAAQSSGFATGGNVEKYNSVEKFWQERSENLSGSRRFAKNKHTNIQYFDGKPRSMPDIRQPLVDFEPMKPINSALVDQQLARSRAVLEGQPISNPYANDQIVYNAQYPVYLPYIQPVVYQRLPYPKPDVSTQQNQVAEMSKYHITEDIKNESENINLPEVNRERNKSTSSLSNEHLRLSTNSSVKDSPDNSGYAAIYQSKKNRKPYKAYTLNDYKKLQKEISLGGLGPDLDSDYVKNKVEQKMRQATYAKDINQKNLNQFALSRPSKYPRPSNDSQTVTKRQIAVEYAKAVPKPKIAPQEKIVQISMSDSPRYSPTKYEPEMIDIEKLKERHEQDKQNVAMFRNKLDTKIS